MVRDTKGALLDVAEQALRVRGVDGFSYADLSEAVGIRKASVHYHFPTKAALTAALLDRYHATLVGRCAEIEAGHPTGGQRLLAIVQVYRDALGEGKMLCLCVALIASRESLSDEVREKITDFRAMMLGWLRAVFDLGARDQTIARVPSAAQDAAATLALLEGAQIAARAVEDVSAFDAALATVSFRCRRV